MEDLIRTKREGGQECSPREVALKTFFLGPQAENSDWVKNSVDLIFDRWFNWRRSLFPEDGCAISLADQTGQAFRDRRQRLEEGVLELLQRFETEVPKFSPRYIGHMFSEISLPALLGHIIALLHNPNNITGETARVGTRIEDEAIRELAGMIGYPTQGATSACGHFTSGGSVANDEALYRARTRYNRWLSMALAARQAHVKPAFSKKFVEASLMGWDNFDYLLNEFRKLPPSELAEHAYLLSLLDTDPLKAYRLLTHVFQVESDGPVVLVPESKHYSWPKAASLLGMGQSACWPVELDRYAKMNIQNLNDQIEQAIQQQRPPIAVVSVVGSTELGNFDPVHEVADLLDTWRKRGLHIWHHIDAAYGGFFCSLGSNLMSEVLSEQASRALQSLGRSDSITLDPHKLGYVPYASGTFLCREERNYTLVSTRAPYLEFNVLSNRGPFTIEGSRSAAGACATWLSSQAVGLHADGYGLILKRTVKAKLYLERLLKQLNESGELGDIKIRLAPHTESNVCCFTCAADGEALSQSNARTESLIQAFSTAGGNGRFFVSKTLLGFQNYGAYAEYYCNQWNAERDDDGIRCFRLCLMNPFFDSKESGVQYAEEFISELKAAVVKGKA